MVLVGMAIPGIRAWNGQMPTFVYGFESLENATDYMSEMYFPTYAHASPYFIGILVAYYLKTGLITMKLNLVSLMLAWNLN